MGGMSGDSVSTAEHKHKCPVCRSGAVNRSHLRGLFDKLLFLFFRVRPYRCQECDRRYYARQSNRDKQTSS
jgi:ribosomal protein L37AE/L43A